MIDTWCGLAYFLSTAFAFQLLVKSMARKMAELVASQQVHRTIDQMIVSGYTREIEETYCTDGTVLPKEIMIIFLEFYHIPTAPPLLPCIPQHIMYWSDDENNDFVWITY